MNSDMGATPMPLRVADPAVVLTGSAVIKVADSQSAETVISLARHIKTTKKELGSLYAKATERGDEWRASGEHWDKVAAWWADRQNSTAKQHMKEQAEGKAAYQVASEGRTVLVSGFGARLTVKGGNLVVSCGRSYSTEKVPQETLYRGIHGVSSLVWLTNGGAGLLTVEALKWLAGQGITLRILTNRGEHLLTQFPSPHAPLALGYPGQENGKADVALRRLQYDLVPSGRDIPLARAIILRKLEGQWNCLDRHMELPDRERAYSAIKVAHDWLSLDPPTPATSSLAGIRLYEARAAMAYFAGWQGLQLRLDSSAEKKWPAPWKTMGERKSQLTRWRSPQLAVNPAQAMLNFAYSVLESQIRQALNAIGVDTSCGVLHSDQDGRESLVYDIMEGLRGEIDHLLLDFIRSHVFSAGDFNVMSTGALTIHPSLCRVLAEMVRVPQRKADDEARWFRSQLVAYASEWSDRRKPRRLNTTETNKSEE